MRYGSLCTGIGGLDLAVEKAFDATPAWFCENDLPARYALGRHWPNIPILEDLKTEDWTSVEPVELVCAGYPCQPFSVAGRRAGTGDPRHLWPYVIAAVRVLRPRIVVLENVAGHLGLGFDVVLGDLAEAGFDAEWTVVRASDVGACHRRERLFVVADATGTERRTSQLQSVGASAGSAAELGERISPSVADTAHVGRERERNTRGWLDGSEDSGWGDYGPAVDRWTRVLGRPAPAPADNKGRLNVDFVEWMMGFDEGWVDGLSRTAALKCLGNAVVQQQAKFALGRLRDS
jgi:DNA (cytosine-5)-methyltransferase 1